MAIYKPAVVQKSIPTHAGDLEHGAEIYLLHEDDYQHNNNPDYFKIKLAYNGIHHYLTVIPKGLNNYFDSHQNAMYFLKNARSALKNFHSQLPQGSNYQKLVKISYLALTSTATVLTGCNPHTGTTGTAGAASPAVFDFPSEELLPSKGGRKRKKADPSAASTSQQLPGEEEEEEEGELEFEAPEEDDSPVVTLLHEAELKKGPKQCFCGKAGFGTTDELEQYKQDTHIGKGKGTNKKTGKPKDLWICSKCSTQSSDNRAAWKHFRTQHLNLFIHNCPVQGCNIGNDQKDSVVSHIIKDHPTERDLVAKCREQSFLRCRKCMKMFRSVKGKNLHEANCGKPVIKLNCPFEGCHKTYRAQERLDDHIQQVHEGQGHKCLCPVCGFALSSTQALDYHLKAKHNQ